jgi:N-acetylneuraminic acid mutarotase
MHRSSWRAAAAVFVAFVSACENPVPSVNSSSVTVVTPSPSSGTKPPIATPDPVAPTPQPTQDTPWRQVGDLRRARVEHTATVLDDGRILVAGGRGEKRTRASVELFDPATGSWSVAARMYHARADHVAVRLDDGRVLVTGGFDFDTRPFATSLRSTEIYDPSSDTWTRVGAAPGTAYGGTVAPMQDGRVLIHVAEHGDGRTVGLLAAFDPARGQWIRVARTPQYRARPTITELNDRSILQTGGSLPGFDGPPNPTRDAWRYDPPGAAWTKIPRMRNHGFGHTATLLADGRVLVVGELRHQLFDPVTESWVDTSLAAVNRTDHRVVTLDDGRVLVVGRGGCRINNDNKLAEIYDPTHNEWRDAGRLPYEFGVSAAVLLDGRVLVTGGGTSCPIDRGGEGGPFSDAFILDVADIS